MERPKLALLLSATLIEAPHPQEVNYLAGKEAPSMVLINYLWRYNYSEYGMYVALAYIFLFNYGISIIVPNRLISITL